LSRQRLRPSLGEGSNITCPRCNGTGHIRGTESTALHILRIIQEEAMKENSASVHAQVPVDVATFLLNEKRADIHSIEARLKVNVVLIPNVHLETPNYKVERLRHDDLNQAEALPPSYDLATAPAEESAPAQAAQEVRPVRQQAAVQGVTPERPAPVTAPRPPATQPAEGQGPVPSQGVMGRIFSWLRGDRPISTPPQPPVPAQPRREFQQNRPERRDGRDRDRERFRSRGESRQEPRSSRGERPRFERSDRPPQSPQGGQRQARDQRPEPRGQRQPMPEGRAPATRSGTPDQSGGDSERNRRRRGRDRDRGERRGSSAPAQRNGERRPVQPAASSMPPATAAPISEPAERPAPEVPAREYPAAAEIQAEHRAAPVQAEPRPIPPAPDPNELEKALTESGLEQVRTRASTVAEPVSEPEFVPAKRSRRSPPSEFGEPMVQVETTRKEDAST